MQENSKAKPTPHWRKWVIRIILVLGIIQIFEWSIVQIYKVPTESMKPTLLPHDRIFVNKAAYGFKVPFTKWLLRKGAAPQRGDIVVFQTPSYPNVIVKRIMGIPGDSLLLRNNMLFINGVSAQYHPLNGDSSAGMSHTRQDSIILLNEEADARKHSIMLIASKASISTFGPVVVPEGKYFILGDNRDNSLDSRHFGMITRKDIFGKATRVVFALARDNSKLPRLHRFFQPVH